MLRSSLSYLLSLAFVFLSDKVSGNGYIAVTTSMSPTNAEAYCQSTYGTSLATILSAEDNSQVVLTAQAAGITGAIYAGATDAASEGTWIWSDGSGLITSYYNNWNSGEPNNSGGEHYLEISASSGGWNDQDDGVSWPFVCNYPQYVAPNVQLNWQDANAYCSTNYGTNLATIPNEDSNAFAYDAKIGVAGIDDAWIGLYDTSGSNTLYEWQDGTTNLVYTNWGSGEPNNPGSEQCGMFFWGVNSWNNGGCNGVFYFVCDFSGSIPPTAEPSNLPTGSPTKKPTDLPSSQPTDMPTARPSDVPSSQPTDMPTYYECDLLNDNLIVSWDDLFGDMSSLNWTSSIDLTQGIDSISGTFEVNVNVKSKYIIGATYDTYSTIYESITENGYLGVTYVVDTNEFKSEGRLISNANTCENRLTNSFSGKNFLTDYWDYTLVPSQPGNLGNDLYLEYGDQNIWDISLSDDDNEDCGNVIWSNTFSFYDLWNLCKDSNDDPSFELIESDDKISLNLNFYLTIVSPNPLFLTNCNSGDDDCGQYLVKTLISHPLSIVFSKISNSISNKNDVFIDLFTSTIIGSTFIESSIETNESSKFILTLITSVPFYMYLDINTALILSPTQNELETNNNNLNFISQYYILEETSSYANSGDCLVSTQYRCFQKFEITIEIDECPSDLGLEFDGNYFFSADFNCINGNEDSCDDFISDEPLSITLDSVNLEYNELCDSTLYEIDWNGDISFYTNDLFDETENSFSFGDTVYTRVSISNDISNYQIFGMSIVQCYLCTSNISDSDTTTTLSSCLDAQVDTSLFYQLPQDVSTTSINSDTSDTFEDFSFELAAVADDTFYVDCVVELEVNSVIDNGGSARRRRRALLQSSDVSNGNLFQSYIASATVTSENDDVNGNNGSSSTGDSISTFYFILIGVGCLVILLLSVFIFLLYRNCHQSSTKTLNTALEIAQNNKNKDILATRSPSGGMSVETSVKFTE